MQTKFYIKKNLSSKKLILWICFFIFILATVLYVIQNSSNAKGVMFVFFIIAFDSLIQSAKSTYKAFKLYKLSVNQQPIIRIHESHVSYAIEGNFTSLLFKDMDSVELGQGIFGSHAVSFNFNKELEYQLSTYEQLKLKRKKKYKKWGWSIIGLTVDPKELELSLNHHLEAYKTRVNQIEV